MSIDREDNGGDWCKACERYDTDGPHDHREAPAPVEPEVPARRCGRPGETEPDTRGYMGGV